MTKPSRERVSSFVKLNPEAICLMALHHPLTDKQQNMGELHITFTLSNMQTQMYSQQGAESAQQYSHSSSV